MPLNFYNTGMRWTFQNKSIFKKVSSFQYRVTILHEIKLLQWIRRTIIVNTNSVIMLYIAASLDIAATYRKIITLYEYVWVSKKRKYFLSTNNRIFQTQLYYMNSYFGFRSNLENIWARKYFLFVIIFFTPV